MNLPKTATALSPRGGVRLLGGSLLLLGALLVLAPWTRSQEEDGPMVDDARDALERLVEVRRILSKEKADWQLGKEYLTDRISIVRDEIETLREKVAKDRENITSADTRVAELEEENKQLASATEGLEGVIGELEARVRTLLPRLPAPLQEQVKSFSQGIPEDPSETELSLSKRFQNIVAVMQGIDKFHRDIHVVTESRELPGGSLEEVVTVYAGISQGYYVSKTGLVAGIGQSTETSWEWTPQNDAALAIQAVVDILESRTIASFIQLPFTVQ